MAARSDLPGAEESPREHANISSGEQISQSSQRFENIQTSDHARLHMDNSYTTNFYNPAALFNSVPTHDPSDPVHADFLNACAEGQRQARLDHLIRRGANIDHRDHMQGTPLHHAAFAGHLDTVRYLLDAGADINAAGDWVGTPLGLAAAKGHVAVVQLFLAHRASPNRCSRYVGTATHMACAAGRLDILLLLYQNGARLDVRVAGCTRIHQSFTMPHHKVLSSSRAYNLIPNTKLDILFCSPGALAVWIGHIDIVNWLSNQTCGLQLHESANLAFVNVLPSGLLNTTQQRQKVSLVMLAVSRLKVDVLRWLLARNSNINTLDSMQRNALFWIGNTLIEASYNDDTKIAHSACLSMLLEHGLHVDDRDSRGYTALMHAASETRFHAVRVLLEQGAFVDASDYMGRTPLMIAVCAGLGNRARLAFVRSLCERGADVGLNDVTGRTALDYTGTSKNWEELREVLLRYSNR
jgi:ankyrin repeat protein